MIAMRIMTPTDKKRWRINGLDAFDYVADRLFRAGAFAGHAPIGKAQEDDVPARVKTEFAYSLFRFLLAQVPEVDSWGYVLLAGCEPAPSLTMMTRVGRRSARASRSVLRSQGSRHRDGEQ